VRTLDWPAAGVSFAAATNIVASNVDDQTAAGRGL
jgi:hypothetical protein